ncbi:hypothetical protein MCOR14_006917 [Pyricularia oryzae]|nr:hypothetical protein MCOR13_003042 [Pyricularia oryzae]KAI6633047.1 hypothetical protein MCOR14_006917 [Pyricularia oryzae]
MRRRFLKQVRTKYSADFSKPEMSGQEVGKGHIRLYPHPGSFYAVVAVGAVQKTVFTESAFAANASHMLGYIRLLINILCFYFLSEKPAERWCHVFNDTTLASGGDRLANQKKESPLLGRHSNTIRGLPAKTHKKCQGDQEAFTKLISHIPRCPIMAASRLSAFSDIEDAGRELGTWGVTGYTPNPTSEWFMSCN